MAKIKNKKKTSKQSVFFGIMAILVAIVIFLFSNIPINIESKHQNILSMVYHFGIFFMFTFFLSLALKSNKFDKKIIVIIILVSIIYAISDEIHQLFVLGRVADTQDVLVDMAGSLFALLTLKTLEKFNKI